LQKSVVKLGKRDGLETRVTYKQVKKLKAEDFKRLCGVHLETFSQMVEVVKKADSWRQKTVTPPKLSIEDSLLMTLEYWREYRTYFHLGSDWGVDQSTADRITRKIENILIQAKELRLPGKKRLILADNQLETVLIDVSKTPIERQKKNKRSITVARKKDIRPKQK
jgi:hypothetical protein